MRFALRPYLIAGAAIAGASVFVIAPGAPSLPDVQVPAVQPAGSELNDVNMQDFLGGLGNTEGVLPAPDVVQGPDNAVPDPAGGLPDLGPLDLDGLDLGGVLTPGSLPGFISSDVPAAH